MALLCRRMAHQDRVSWAGVVLVRAVLGHTHMITETVHPAYIIGDRVRFQGRTGTITKVYPASGVPLWYGARRVLHTHCYAIETTEGATWGWVDAELTRENIDAE